jgi:hypothetical protein
VQLNSLNTKPSASYCQWSLYFICPLK